VAVDREAVREAQAIIRRYVANRDRSLVDELLDERRREAEREAAAERPRLDRGGDPDQAAAAAG
jgi:hypothetical protein